METLRSQHYETENANKENSSEFKFITKLGQSIQKLKENLKKFISAPEEGGSGLKEVPIEDDVKAVVREFIEATDNLKDEYELYSSSSGDSTPENHIIIPNQPILTQVINEMKQYVRSNNQKDTGSYVAGIDRIIGKMMRIARTAEEPVETAQGTESEEGEEYKFPEVEALDAALAEEVTNEGGKVESIKTLTRKDFGPMPEDPYNIKNNDLKALIDFFESKPDQFPNGRYVDIRNWADWTPIMVVEPEYINDPNLQWSITKGNDNELIGEFPSKEDAEAEFDRIKKEDKQKALDLLRKARNFTIGEDLDTPWTDPVDVRSTTDEEVAPTQEIPEVQATDSENGGEVLPGSDELRNALNVLVEEIATQESSSVDKNSGSLQQELDRLIEVEAQKLQRDQTTENIFYQVDREKLERFKDNARQAIANYQQFSSEHSSLADKSNPQIQERYQLLEKQAWNSLYSLAHLLDGEIAVLPQDRDIQLSHLEGVDTRQYLESRGYKFDENGDITHITNKGVEIELNRAMKTESLIKSRRPSHIVYDKSISLDSDFNYQGYLVRGLNQQTPDFIVGVLDKNNLEPVIVDETGQSTVTTTEAKQDPWSIESRGDTEFEKIFAGNLSRNKDTQGNNEIPDPWVEKAVIEEPPIIPVFPIPSGDNSDLQSEGAYPLGEEGLETTPQVSLDDLRLAYARAEEAWNRKRGDEKLEDAFIVAKKAYNKELEKVLKLQVANGQADTISQMFKDEVIALRDSRTTQSQELQGKWEKGFNNAKEKFLGWATKNKTRWMLANMGLFAAGALLSSIGVGIPVTGALEMTRRSLGSVMAGVGSRNTLVGLMEDRDIKINKFGLNINFQAEVPKIVKESISEEDEIKAVSEDVLKERLGTLEAYYRLNGGKFTNDNQQQAYEKVLIELARRVQENVIYVENNKDTLQSDWQEQKPQELTDVEIKNLADENLSKRNIIAKSIPFSRNREIERQYDLAYEKDINWEKLNPERYTSELLNTISDKRIVELDKFRRKRQIANVVGFATTGVLGGLLLNDMLKPGGIFRLNIENGGESANNGVSTTPEVKSTGAGTTSTEYGTNPQTSPTPSETPPTDVSTQEGQGTGAGTTSTEYGTNPQTSPTPSETISTDVSTQQAKELSRDVSRLDSGETIWGEITKQLGENASQSEIQQEVENYLQSQVGQESIFELAKQTEGGRELLSQWDIDNIGEMSSLSKDQLYEVSKYLGEGELKGLTELSLDALKQVASTEFTENLSKALGTTNLTEAQLQEVIHSFATSEQGSFDLYNQITSNEEGARFLSGFGVNKAADFTNIRPDRLYEIAQTVGVDNLNQLPGFELNEIILSKFEDAPDVLNLVNGAKPLTLIDSYIAQYAGDLPGSRSIGKLALEEYVLNTDQGRKWLYDAIVYNEDKTSAGAENLQKVKELFSRESIKSPDDLKRLLVDSRGYPSARLFWDKLSWVLKPGPMPGINKALQLVLTKQ